MSKITAVETWIPASVVPNLILVRIHTADGFLGCGETYYTPHAIEAMIHDWFAERLLGADALAVESHWRFLFERCSAFGRPGAEMRALSAIDVALWDILGQACGKPVYRILGGPVRDSVPVYNTCGGPTYGARKAGAGDHPGWPGYGDEGEPGPLQDNWASIHAAGDLAEELVAEGIHGMKVWPFDRHVQRHGGHYLSDAEIEEGMKPLRQIRDRVGMSIEIMIEGHAFFRLPAALRLASALKEIRPLWLEDMLPVDNVETLASFREKAGLPVSVSEMLLGRNEFLSVLNAGAADYVMVDPTWAGGISETRRIVQMAEAFNVPATMHDCTGPITLYAGLHVAASTGGVVFQETVRAHIRSFYKDLIDVLPVIENGEAKLPAGAGLGVRFHDELFRAEQPGYRRSEFTQ